MKIAKYTTEEIKSGKYYTDNEEWGSVDAITEVLVSIQNKSKTLNDYYIAINTLKIMLNADRCGNQEVRRR